MERKWNVDVFEIFIWCSHLVMMLKLVKGEAMLMSSNSIGH